ncbi:hypothetical protein IWZ00DRAFT_497450 [Phyllosticta capitalensis]
MARFERLLRRFGRAAVVVLAVHVGASTPRFESKRDTRSQLGKWCWRSAEYQNDWSNGKRPVGDAAAAEFLAKVGLCLIVIEGGQRLNGTSFHNFSGNLWKSV